MLFSRIFNKEKPRVYVGALLVASKEDLGCSDGWGLFKSENLEEGLRKSLNSAIDLPSVESNKTPKETDLVLDLVVVNHQGGEFNGFHSLEFFIPIFWRPKVEVSARLYNLATGKTVYSAVSLKKTPWGQFFSRAFSVNAVFRFKPLFGAKDMEILLCLAAIDVLEKLTKKL